MAKRTINNQYALDLAIKAKFRELHPFIPSASKNDQYVMDKNGVGYDRYLPNEEWKSFLDEMKSQYNYAFRCYDNGDGGETKENRYPPKMACFGSSSRFIFLESRDMVSDKTDFFEKKLETHVGGTANLDGYLAFPEGHLFVEAKCREIYGSEVKKISVKYLELYRELQNRKLLLFSETPRIKDGVVDNEHADVTFFSPNGKSLSHTDVKQLLCHFLGISAFLMENPDEPRNVSFIYLIFEPNDTNSIFRSKEEQNRVLKVRTQYVPEEFKSIDIPSLFGAVVDYQVKNGSLKCKLDANQVDEIKKGFTFKLCNQREYHELLLSYVVQ